MKIKLPLICLCLIAAAVGGKMSVDFKSDQPELPAQSESVIDQSVNGSYEGKSKPQLALKSTRTANEK